MVPLGHAASQDCLRVGKLPTLQGLVNGQNVVTAQNSPLNFHLRQSSH